MASAVMHGAKDNPAALQAFDRAVTLKPDFVEALNSRGHMRRLPGNLERAMSDFQTVLERSPSHLKAYLNIAQALKVIGQKDALKTCYWENLKLDPGEPSAVRELACVAKGEDVPKLKPHVAQLLEASKSPDARMAGAYLDSAEGLDESGMPSTKCPSIFATQALSPVLCLKRNSSICAAGRTASALQVKQGLYDGSFEAWKRYALWLDEMLGGFGDLLGAP